MKTSIATDRLVMTSVQEGDHAFMLELVNTPGWIQFIGDRKVHTEKEAIQFIQDTLATRSMTYWVARIKTNNIPIGIISFLKRDYLEHYDLGFAFLPLYLGQGYAYEAAAAVLRTMKEMPAHPIVLATTMPSNQKSIHLLEKLGFFFSHEIKPASQKLHVYMHDKPMS